MTRFVDRTLRGPVLRNFRAAPNVSFGSAEGPRVDHLWPGRIRSKQPEGLLMIHRRTFALAGLGGALLAIPLISAALAATQTPFSSDAFQKAQAAGKPILIAVHADWCPTCKAQTPIINELAAQPKFKELTIFRVDFDSQKADVKRFGAQMQSTLIVFKGSKETGRSVGDTKRDSLAALLDKAI
jgi:thioredoxin 1